MNVIFLMVNKMVGDFYNVKERWMHHAKIYSCVKSSQRLNKGTTLFNPPMFFIVFYTLFLSFFLSRVL